MPMRLTGTPGFWRLRPFSRSAVAARGRRQCWMVRFAVCLVPPQRGSPMSAQASGLGKATTKRIEPQPGRPEMVGCLAARVRFDGVHGTRSNRIPFIRAAPVGAPVIGLRPDPGRWPGLAWGRPFGTE